MKTQCLGFIALLSLTVPSAGAAAPAIVVKPGASEAVVLRKVPVVDCRAVRGFLGAPVDGSVHSWDYRGRTQEYPNTASDGVNYSFNRNDGLHLTLADDGGFDVVVLRGGAQTRLYAGGSALVEPKGVSPLWTFRGAEGTQIARFDRRVRAKQVSFFGTRNGTTADVSFYRLGKGSLPARGAERWTPGKAYTLRPPGSEFAPDSLHRAMNERYGDGDRRAVALIPGQDAGQPMKLPRGRAVHFILPPAAEEKGLAGVSLAANLTAFQGPLSLTAAVQDPLAPRLDLAWVELTVNAPGPPHQVGFPRRRRLCAEEGVRLRLGLDFPDQVLLKGSHLWLTLRFDQDVTLAGPRGGAPEFWLHPVPRETALPEALARRKLLLKTYFSLLSEPRPWGAYRRQPREEFFASSPYARQCPDLFMTIDQCHALAPADPMVRQYREWVYLRHLETLSEVKPPPSPPSGVPGWAWCPRLAWLETRRIARWWLDERLVPTGEFGGSVGDDSDLYQQFADLPFFETGGEAARLRDSAARLAELADRERLKGGINVHTTDALHAYEEGINHLALMARWFYGDPIYFERCMDSARNMEKLTILTEDGRRHFRDSDRMGAEDLERSRPPAVDGHAAPLMWHTALQVADYNRNPRALALLREWADSWLKFMKPGQWATAVEVLSGKVLDAEPDRPLYGGYRTQATTFAWLYELSGDPHYLEPFLHYYRQGRAPYPADRYLGDAFTLGALTGLSAETLRQLAADHPALPLYLNDDPGPLVQATIGSPRSGQAEITNLHDARRWPDMYTVTHQFTDRVFPSLLQHASVSYLGGFTHRNKFNPTLAVGWEGFGTEYGALVRTNERDRLKLSVYSFADRPMKGEMRVWALEHGRYRLAIGAARDGNHRIDRVRTTTTQELARGDALPLTLQPRAVTVVELEQVERLDPLLARADLAIAAREVTVNGTTLTGTVHNIGAAGVPDAVAAVIDGTGRTIARQSLGRLPAPLDLNPQRRPFTLRLPGRPEKGWKLVLDPDRSVPEIYEGNNEVALEVGT
jgi:hypothetical protein